MRSAAPCAHINSSVRLDSKRYRPKCRASDPALLRLRTPSPSVTVLAYGTSVFLTSWCSWPRRRTGLSSRMCRCGWVISDINRPAIAPSAQANHNAGSGRIHGAQHGPGSSCEDERLAGAGSRRVQGRWIGIALSQGALSAYAAAGIGDLIEDASSGGCWQLSRSTSRSACPTRDADSYADHTDGRARIVRFWVSSLWGCAQAQRASGRSSTCLKGLPVLLQ